MTEKEFNDCVNLYADNVYRFIVKNLKHEQDARDVVQASFEKMWINRDRVENERSKSYLFTVAYHQMIDLIRKNKKTKLEEDFSSSESLSSLHAKKKDKANKPIEYLSIFIKTSLYNLKINKNQIKSIFFS